MRQTQSNRRGRGRSRKAQNPLTKNYESNGPDVKIRGTAAHISEKYTSLARDALTSSDIVRYENYLQHAEHYNRIIAAAQQNNQNAAENKDSQQDADDAGGAEQQAQNQGQGQNQGQSNSKRQDGRKNNRRRRPEPRSETKSQNSETDKHANGSNGRAVAENGSDEKAEKTSESAGKKSKEEIRQVGEFDAVSPEGASAHASPEADDAAA